MAGKLQKKKKEERMHSLVSFSLPGSKVSEWLALIMQQLKKEGK